MASSASKTVTVMMKSGGRIKGEITQNGLIREIECREGLVNVRRCATADQRASNAWLMQRPRDREMGLRVAGALGDGFKPRKALIRRVMKIDLLMPGDDLEA